MSKDVNTALEEILDSFFTDQKYSLSPGKFLQKMKEESRYLVDVWS